METGLRIKSYPVKATLFIQLCDWGTGDPGQNLNKQTKLKLLICYTEVELAAARGTGQQLATAVHTSGGKFSGGSQQLACRYQGPSSVKPAHAPPFQESRDKIEMEVVPPRLGSLVASQISKRRGGQAKVVDW